MKWLRKCFRCPSTSHILRRHGTAHLSLEGLEDRTVPTAIAVTIASDPLGSHTGISLRDAIKAVNAGSDNTIDFNIQGSGTHVILLNAALPAISKEVTIDGTTQPGYSGTPLIALTRANSSVGGNGLLFTGGGATVQGLAIYGFAGYGLDFEKGGGNNVLSDFIGVTAGGVASGNGLAGIILDHASNDVISSSTISNNAQRGICIDDSANVVIGGQNAGNTISGNGVHDPDWAGIAIIDGSSDVTVSNNSLTGNGRGIRVSGSSSITIENNTVTGNATQGIWIDNALGGSSSNVELMSNVVDGNTGVGVMVDYSTSVSFTYNTIDNNGNTGIVVGNGCQTISFAYNTIEGNKGYGVNILSASVTNPDGTNTILNNTLGAIHGVGANPSPPPENPTPE